MVIVDADKQAILLTGWILLFILIVYKPHRVFSSIKNLIKAEHIEYLIGVVKSFEDPNLIHIKLEEKIPKRTILKLCKEPYNLNSNIFAIVIKVYNTPDGFEAIAILINECEEDWNNHKFVYRSSLYDIQLSGNCKIIKNYEDIVGYVSDNSDVEKIIIDIFDDRGMLSNYDIVETHVNDKVILYQIVNVRTSEESDKSNVWGYKKAYAYQVGSWNEEQKKFDDYKWVPSLNNIVFKSDKYCQHFEDVPYDKFVIGNFHTGHPIYVDWSDIVTHNTAILGVTGSGKSYFTYTLVEKILNNKTKMICIDNTGDYLKNIRHEDIFIINKQEDIDTFLASQNLIAIANAITVDSTLLIVSKAYEWAKKQYDPTNNDLKPKISVLIEEAHLLIPEWNSVVQKGDVEKVNSISKFVMQGRKYGFGVVVITQRTANVTKSVLSQCNTIITFKAFDKTSNDFLSSFLDENYINSIGRLNTGESIISGKALVSGRPVAIKSLER